MLQSLLPPIPAPNVSFIWRQAGRVWELKNGGLILITQRLVEGGPTGCRYYLFWVPQPGGLPGKVGKKDCYESRSDVEAAAAPWLTKARMVKDKWK